MVLCRALTIDDGQYMISGAQDGTVRLWDTTSQAPVGRAVSIAQPVVEGEPADGRLYPTSVTFSPGDRLIVAGLNDGSIRVWPGPATWTSELCAKLTTVMNSADWDQSVASYFGYVPVCPDLPPEG
jgi:WD40 repeat protein